MKETENKTKDLIFYSQREIGFATFIGGPLAAGYLIRENFNTLNNPDEGKKALIIGIIATIIMFTGIFMTPENIMDKIPNQVIPFIYTGIIYLIVERLHGKILKQHKENKNEFYSGWKAAGIGFISLIIMSVGIFGYAFLAPVGAEYEMYDTELAKFSKNEEETLVFYDHIDTETNRTLIKELENKVIPKWKENVEIIKGSNQIENLPTELIQQNNILLEYSELRIKAFELFKKAISEDSDKYSEQLQQIHVEIDKQLEKLN